MVSAEVELATVSTVYGRTLLAASLSWYDSEKRMLMGRFSEYTPSLSTGLPRLSLSVKRTAMGAVVLTLLTETVRPLLDDEIPVGPLHA